MPRITTPTAQDRARAQAQLERRRRETKRQRKRDADIQRRDDERLYREALAAVSHRRAVAKAHRWRYDAACFVCGSVTEPTPRDDLGRTIGSPRSTLQLSLGRFGLGHGWIVSACKGCRPRIDRAGERRESDVAVVTARLEAVRPGYLTDDVRRSQLPALLWLGRVDDARESDEPDPDPPAEPFGHLPESLDLPPAPTPTQPEPAPNPRRIDGGCLICGTTDVYRNPLRSGFARGGGGEIRRFDARDFGLDRAGGDVSGEMCLQCRGTFDAIGLHYFTDDASYGRSAGVAVTTRSRMVRIRPEAWPLGPSDNVALHELAPLTFAGAAVLAREEERPEPSPTAEPFGWLP